MEKYTVLILPLLLVAAVGYLLGSVSFAILLTRLFANHEDVRNFGSGNAGATNVLRVAGKKASALTFVCDFLKCAASVAVGYFVVGYVSAQNGIDPEMAKLGMYAAGFLCIIGHMFPLYFGFRGGKGVVTTAAMMLLLDWRVFLICFSVFLVLVFWKRMVSLASVCGCAIYPVITFLVTFFVDCAESPLSFHGDLPVVYVVMATVVAAMIGFTVVFKHRANIARIRAGKESTLSFKKSV